MIWTLFFGKLNDNNKADGLIFESFQYGPQISSLEVYEMKSIWEGNDGKP
ncbi:MAG: hypothetical protein ABI687_00835 [Flavitalea sp.]